VKRGRAEQHLKPLAALSPLKNPKSTIVIHQSIDSALLPQRRTRPMMEMAEA
jgi:hypothetical protein